jgi:hypothetical protein
MEKMNLFEDGRPEGLITPEEGEEENCSFQMPPSVTFWAFWPLPGWQE